MIMLVCIKADHGESEPLGSTLPLEYSSIRRAHVMISASGAQGSGLEALLVYRIWFPENRPHYAIIMRHFFTNMKTEYIYNLFKKSKGISTDSRTVGKGQIFFALWGDNYNGNKFAAEALERGALYAVIDDPLFETENTILVDDCLFELQVLASQFRKEMKVPVLAITGTNGKTTTKELLATILSKKFKVHYTKGNLNNHIGVPLTILSAPADTEMLIIEMGASHIGEIRTLCRSEEHTSELQSRQYLHSFPTRRSSDL